MAELSRHARRRLRTRARLLSAAEALLIASGYDHLTVRQITDRADVARATFYVHFPDKEAVVWALLEQRIQAIVSAFHADEPADTLARRKRRWLLIFSRIDQDRALMSVLISERGHIRLRQQIAAFLAQTLRADLEAGQIAPTAAVPVAMEAHFYAGAMLEVIAWWLREAPDRSPAQLADDMSALVLRVLPSDTESVANRK